MEVPSTGTLFPTRRGGVVVGGGVFTLFSEALSASDNNMLGSNLCLHKFGKKKTQNLLHFVLHVKSLQLHHSPKPLMVTFGACHLPSHKKIIPQQKHFE
jgi:hypothetical protein